jgi:methionyl-tRNA formyltransferase
MVVDILGEPHTEAYALALRLLTGRGHTLAAGDAEADLAVAPLLTKKIGGEKLSAPRLGTLIFHPSPLPYGRGASAIRWAYRRREPVTAATWFWATERLDAGDICEQEIVRVDYALRPREFYEQEMLPAMLRTLERALIALEQGVARRAPQVEKYATYDGRLQ